MSRNPKWAAQVSLTQCLTMLFAIAFLLILLMAYLGMLPGHLTRNDKAAHLILYGIATLLGHLACHRRRLTLAAIALPLFPALFMLFTLAEEALQQFSPNRTFDQLDLLASIVGILAGYGLAERFSVTSGKKS